MEANNNTKGILFIMIGMAFFSIQDSLIKYIFEEIALFELYLGRTIVQATVLISIFLITKKKFTLKTHYPLLTLLRVICCFLLPLLLRQYYLWFEDLFWTKRYLSFASNMLFGNSECWTVKWGCIAVKFSTISSCLTIRSVRVTMSATSKLVIGVGPAVSSIRVRTSIGESSVIWRVYF